MREHVADPSFEHEISAQRETFTRRVGVIVYGDYQLFVFELCGY